MFAMNSCSHKCASKQIRYGKAGKSTSISRKGNKNLLLFESIQFSSPSRICRLAANHLRKRNKACGTYKQNHADKSGIRYDLQPSE